ncbi:MAG: SPASM domain-containing protein [Lachnospiraceae bacterium]
MRIRKEIDFISMFDEKTGRYTRSGIIKNGKDTGIDPFMSSFPELLDVGIMGHCKHGQTGLCIKAGIECYQDGLHANNSNMALEDFRRIARECEGKTFQFALGGCGDPDQHENFKEILEICKEHKIVPNFTSSGFGMDESLAELCKEYCGAVAISWYRSSYTLMAINTLVKAGIRTNIHYVLNKDTIFEAINLLDNEGFPKGVNAIVFLLHKPVGLGSHGKMIDAKNEEFKEFLSRIDENEYPYKIGFDSCTVPSLISCCKNIEIDSLDTCEGARWSAYITADMKLLPCSFDNQDQRWAVDLRENSIQEAWNSELFDDFRKSFREACPDCKDRAFCMGGCPIRPEIVLCNQRLSTH